MSENATEPSWVPKRSIVRNSYGLIEGVEYKYTPEGLIDWRKMINPKHLVVNKQSFERQNKPIPDSIEGLEDKDLLILLAGIKELAVTRGYESVLYKVTAPNDSCVIAACNINWIPNFENQNQDISFSSIGDATYANATGFGKMFLGPIAENRSFVRCVRNFLRVNILGQDELTPKMEAMPDAPASSKNLLEDTMREYGIEFKTVKNTLLRDKVPNAENMNSVSDIPKRLQLELIARIKKKMEDKATGQIQ